MSLLSIPSSQQRRLYCGVLQKSTSNIFQKEKEKHCSKYHNPNINEKQDAYIVIHVYHVWLYKSIARPQ